MVDFLSREIGEGMFEDMDLTSALAWIVAFLIVTVTVTGLSRRVGWSAPVALIAIGAGVSFVPWVPRVDVQPDFVLSVLLPPLLFAAALRMSFIDVRARRDSILLLSVGLVGFTVITVGLVTWLVVPTLSLAAAFAFGAVVAPTDAVAVTAVTRRTKLPRLLTTLLDGESLLNDATALVALNASIAAIVAVFNPFNAAADFVVAVICAVGVGLVGGTAIAEVRRRLSAPVLDTCLSLVTPFVIFLTAQAIGGSGPLAVVVAGLLLGYRAPAIQSAEARIAESLNWRTIQFILENAVFLLIGLSLPSILAGALSSGISLPRAFLIIAAVLATLFGGRAAWSLFITAIFRWGPPVLRRRQWTWRTNVPVTLAGIRGVVTLAAVFLLPESTPHRGFLQFLAFVVVVVSLLQALALPWAIRLIALPAPNLAQERMEVQLLTAEAQNEGLRHLESLADLGNAEERVFVRLRANASFLDTAGDDPESTTTRSNEYARLRMLMIAVERRTTLAARAEGRYQEPAVRAVLTLLDIEEAAVRAAAVGPEDD